MIKLIAVSEIILTDIIDTRTKFAEINVEDVEACLKQFLYTTKHISGVKLNKDKKKAVVILKQLDEIKE